jgi:predicted SnoaL-like aldol condensation-catalyzing enzyme
MKPFRIALPLVLFFHTCLAWAQDPSPTEVNKKIARDFYEDLWFNQNTENYTKYVADTYIVHDIGDRKNLEEPAVEQKEIADFFWSNGEMSGEIDYQIASGDLVATRWHWKYKPKTLFGKTMLGGTGIPIINVFRIEDGKIVEIWNHRHDIDTGMTRKFTFQGVFIGVLLTLAIQLIIRLIRKRRSLRTA